MFGLSLGTCWSNLRSIALTVLELLAFNNQKFKGSRDPGHTFFEKFQSVCTSVCMSVCVCLCVCLSGCKDESMALCVCVCLCVCLSACMLVREHSALATLIIDICVCL